MKKIGVLFGGQSVEHEVSIITGMQVIENMDKDLYDPVPVYISKEGRWLGGDRLKDFKTFKDQDFSGVKEVYFKGQAGDHKLYAKEVQEGGLFAKAREEEVVYADLDLVLPALHGTYGEDGRVQGLMDTIGIPYAGCSTMAAALGMDKVLMKQVFIANEIPVMDYTHYYRSQYEARPQEVIDRIEALGYPVFVKPANLGSSIGISRVESREDLEAAIDLANSYDRKVIVERAAKEPREINAAVLGFEDQLEVSACEEPVGWKDFLNFEDKYVKSSAKKGGTKSSQDQRNIPADLDPGLQAQVEDLAKKAFRAIDAGGTARVDFLVEEGKPYVNEINTLPGSLGFYLWEPNGLDFKGLITRLIELGEARASQDEKNLTNFDANLLQRTGYGSKL